MPETCELYLRRFTQESLGGVEHRAVVRGAVLPVLEVRRRDISVDYAVSGFTEGANQCCRRSASGEWVCRDRSSGSSCQGLAGCQRSDGQTPLRCVKRDIERPFCSGRCRHSGERSRRLHGQAACRATTELMIRRARGRQRSRLGPHQGALLSRRSHPHTVETPRVLGRCRESVHL